VKGPVFDQADAHIRKHITSTFSNSFLIGDLLSQELIDINDNYAAIGLSLALLDIILLVLMIRFFKTSRKKERYNTPLVETQLPAA